MCDENPISGASRVASWCQCKNRIDAIVQKIRDMVWGCDPLRLLAYCHSRAMLHFREAFSGIRVGESPMYMGEMRAAEYVQSILVNMPLQSDEIQHTSGIDKFCKVVEKIGELFGASMPALLFAPEVLAASGHECSKDEEDAQCTAMCMYIVRGRRHIAYHKAYLSVLLPAHEHVLQSCYGIGSAEIIYGFEKLVWFLMLGNPPKGNSLSKFVAQEVLDQSSFDVAKITGWPIELLDDLSLSCCSNQNEISRSALSGWIFSDSIIKEKPFLRKDGRYYAFSYHIVSDYFYRALQFAVTKRTKMLDVKYLWKDNQAKASEEFASEVMKFLLPRCQTSMGNYYQVKGGGWRENDLLVRYGDVLIILEVKGVAFSHKSPAEDPDEVLSRYDHLRKAIDQCRRTEAYVFESTDNNHIPFWSDEKCSSRKAIDVRESKYVFKIALTVDNVNEIASCATTLKNFAGESQGVVCLSIDDMIVYANNFKSAPALFLHYLQERTAATSLIQLRTYDELDHLDAYSGNPHYAELVEESCRGGSVNFVNIGCGSDLDTTKTVLPNVPPAYQMIFDHLGKVGHGQILAIVSLLMSFDANERNYISECILKALSKSRERGHAISFRNPPESGRAIFITVCEGSKQLDEFCSGCRRVAQEEMRQEKHDRFDLLTIVFCGEIREIKLESVA